MAMQQLKSKQGLEKVTETIDDNSNEDSDENVSIARNMRSAENNDQARDALSANEEAVKSDEESTLTGKRGSKAKITRKSTKKSFSSAGNMSAMRSQSKSSIDSQSEAASQSASRVSERVKTSKRDQKYRN